MISEARKDRATRKKRRIAERIDSAELLVSGLRFYWGALKPGKPYPASLLLERSKYLSSKFKAHLWAARRVLGIAIQANDKLVRLPLNYWARLHQIGLTLADFDTKKAFEELSGDLVIDQRVKAFAAMRPSLLNNVKDWLLAQVPEEAKPALPPDDDYSKHLQGQVFDILAAWRGD